jgi:hypothetical protein
MPTLAIYETPLGIGISVDHDECGLKPLVEEARGLPPSPRTMFERQVVSDAKDPALKI